MIERTEDRDCLVYPSDKLDRRHALSYKVRESGSSLGKCRHPWRTSSDYRRSSRHDLNHVHTPTLGSVEYAIMLNEAWNVQAAASIRYCTNAIWSMFSLNGIEIFLFHENSR
jgi:hypothetical protein